MILKEKCAIAHRILHDHDRAVRLEWLTLAFLVTAVSAMYFALGNSAAMRAAWIEDLLSFLPPIAFLVTNRIRAKESDGDHPFGFHRAVGYLVAASALLIMGTYLVMESALGLVSAEHAPIGLVTVFGYTFWAGWLMVAVLAYTLGAAGAARPGQAGAGARPA
ncbi:MAG: cation transporter [Actinomycetota bacterium]|nr:cation transporter [Actinomycetota bacterium]